MKNIDGGNPGGTIVTTLPPSFRALNAFSVSPVYFKENIPVLVSNNSIICYLLHLLKLSQSRKLKCIYI
jgi:hypothetical protein